MINEYDEIKKLIKRSKMLLEQKGPINLAKSIEDTTSDYETGSDVDPEKVKKDKTSKAHEKVVVDKLENEHAKSLGDIKKVLLDKLY